MAKLDKDAKERIKSNWNFGAGRVLKTVREDHKDTQEDLASYLGISVSQYSRVELGKAGHWLHWLPLIALRYNWRVTDLIKEIESYSKRPHR